MAHLSLSLLGSFQVALDGQPVTAFKSNKVRALLAYLAVEADRPHRRELLAGLLWPDWPDRDAMSSLRYTLSDLRQAIGDREAEPPYLLISREALQFNRASDHWLDVAAFTELLAGDRGHPHITEQLEEAVGLVQGDFLEGFTVGDSPVFEEWVLLTRERLARQVSSTLHELAAIQEWHGEYAQAQAWAWRQLELEPWDETAHQALMRSLALGGQRSAALAQYESCRRVLAEELGVEPGEETTWLYEQIRDGKLRRPDVAPEPPAGTIAASEARDLSVAPAPKATARQPRFIEEEAPRVERPLFVARERELAQLDRYLEQALAGQGRVAFVIGEMGIGKTALMQEFTQRAQEAHADLVVASGYCNAHTGIGDPYLPFREIMELLTGDVEARWAVGAIGSDHARRLWHLLPLTAQALVEVGPDLIDTFVPRAALFERATMHASEEAAWLNRLDRLVERKPAGPGMPGPQQSDLFEQYARVLQALAQRMPLLLLVDDLQWGDLGSISLLFHLGRRLSGSRILVVGAYRSEDVAIGRDGQRHPLDPVVNELQHYFGDISVNVGQAERRAFVEALLDSEPNRLGVEFREMLHRQTRGHPLFTTELLRGLIERGDLVHDTEGLWAEGPTLDWETLPTRVEAVIAERIGRVAEPLQSALRVASVEGEVFTAEVVARVQGTDPRQVVERLSGELDRRHRLVRAQGILRVDGQRLSQYRFRHTLFQRYLYNSLDEVERVHLHEAVGNTLEVLYEGQAEVAAAIAGQLAWHFQEAGIAAKAIHYLHQAGERAVQLSAYQEAIAHLTRGLAAIAALPDTPARSEQELTLQLSLGMANMAREGAPSEVRKAYIRARELCQQTGKTSQLSRIQGHLATMDYVLAEHPRARELAEEALSLAEQARDPLLVALNHWRLGFILFAHGDYAASRAHFVQVAAFYEPRHHASLVFLSGSDAGLSAMAYDAGCLWCLGYPEQALERGQEVLDLGRELGHPFTLADVIFMAGCMLNSMRRDAQSFKEHAEAQIRLSDEKGMPTWLPLAICFRGEAMIMLGQIQEGMRQLQEGVAMCRSQDTLVYLPQALCFLAEAQAMAGQTEEGLATLAEALVLVEQTNERHWQAELLRLQGELLRAQGDEVGAEASLTKAIEVARRQQARSWELRATVSLCRLRQDQGKADLARQVLTEVYSWFTEGFETADLKEARALLAELSG